MYVMGDVVSYLRYFDLYPELPIIVKKKFTFFDVSTHSWGTQ